jgi:hypothetical protein
LRRAASPGRERNALLGRARPLGTRALSCLNGSKMPRLGPRGISSDEPKGPRRTSDKSARWPRCRQVQYRPVSRGQPLLCSARQAGTSPPPDAWWDIDAWAKGIKQFPPRRVEASACANTGRIPEGTFATPRAGAFASVVSIRAFTTSPGIQAPKLPRTSQPLPCSPRATYRVVTVPSALPRPAVGTRTSARLELPAAALRSGGRRGALRVAPWRARPMSQPGRDGLSVAYEAGRQAKITTPPACGYPRWIAPYRPSHWPIRLERTIADRWPDLRVNFCSGEWRVASGQW